MDGPGDGRRQHRKRQETAGQTGSGWITISTLAYTFRTREMKVRSKTVEFRQGLLGSDFSIGRTPDSNSPTSCSKKSSVQPMDTSSQAVMACQDNIEFMRGLPDGSMKLIVTSPPYNIGKPYEKRSPMGDYIRDQERVISECVRLLHINGSLCWQCRQLRG